MWNAKSCVLDSLTSAPSADLNAQEAKCKQLQQPNTRLALFADAEVHRDEDTMVNVISQKA